MYFVIEGTVNVMSPNERQIVAQLGSGTRFGELAMVIETRRSSSCIAEDFCLLFILKKQVLDHILKRFPLINEMFKVEGYSA